MAGKKRICVIGAGPSGMSALYQLEAMRQKLGNDGMPEVVCYEKQSNWGGLWNYTWRTGSDAHGEPIHGSMYRYLWSNGPKEALELPDYTFEQHFGKAIPSFPPREVLFDYLQGRWQKADLRRHVKFDTVVRNVRHDEASDRFVVTTENLSDERRHPDETFDFVMVATGHFSVPHVPEYPGVDKFPGRKLHAHDFRDAREFSGQSVLVVGSSYSAEDIALQCMKYGASKIIITYRSRPMGFKWPAAIEERPLLTRVDGKTVRFSDGTAADVDAILFCTGYLHHYPFLSEDIRLRCKNVLYPANLYKGVLFTEGGNNKVLYIGAQDQYYTFTMFDVQAHWAVRYVLGDIDIKDNDDMRADWKTWVERCENLKDEHEEIEFQTDHIKDMAADSGYKYDVDAAAIFFTWEEDKMRNILAYRDASFASIFTGTQSPTHHTTFMNALDDSMACFLSSK